MSLDFFSQLKNRVKSKANQKVYIMYWLLIMSLDMLVRSKLCPQEGVVSSNGLQFLFQAVFINY